MRLNRLALLALVLVPSLLLARAVRPPPGAAVTQYYANQGLPTTGGAAVNCSSPSNDIVRRWCCGRGNYAYCQNANTNWQTNNCFPLVDGTTQCCPWGQVATGKHQPDQVCIQRNLINNNNETTVLAMANLPPWVIATLIKQHLDILWCYEAGIAWCTNPGNGITPPQRKQCIELFFIRCLEESNVYPGMLN